VKIFDFLKMYAVALTPHAQNFRTTSKSDNDTQNGDALHKKLKITHTVNIVLLLCVKQQVVALQKNFSTKNNRPPPNIF
jgi:NAD(P)H-hydrate repair Nnr-like enzyme with NAD(P)H-hydrate dehydratase domain